MTRTLATLTALTTLLLVLAGCGGTPAAPESGPGSGAASPAETFPRDVTVANGTVHLDARPERIVVLGPSLTETVFGVGAGRQVTAVDKLSNYPADAPRSDLDAFQPNVEAVAAQQPDLVLVTDDMNNVVSGLQKLKIPVAQVPAPQDLDGALAQFGTVGQLTGHTAEATQLAEKTRATIADAVGRAPAGAQGTTYYWEIDPTYYSVTSQTFVGSVLAQFGLVNIADRAKDTAGGYPKLSAEFIIDADPDLIFLADGICCGQDAQLVRKRDGWDVTRAVKDPDGVVAIDDDVASRWGPRVADVAVAVSEALRKTSS